MLYANRKTELAFLCILQHELVNAILDIETCDYEDTVYIGRDDVFMLGRRKSRWVIIDAIDNKVISWVTRGSGDFARLMTKWLSINGYRTI